MFVALTVLLLTLASNRGMCSKESPVSVERDVNSDNIGQRSSSSPTAIVREDFAGEDRLLIEANHSRALIGAAPLHFEESLRVGARIHARLMIGAQRLDHRLPGELPLIERLGSSTSLNMDRVGENIAFATCVAGAAKALMNSPSHRSNLLDLTFNVVGIAVFWNGGSIYVVQDFGHELPSYSAEESRRLISSAVGQIRGKLELPELVQFRPQNIDESACSLANKDHLDALFLAALYHINKSIAYTQSDPGTLSNKALRLLSDVSIHQISVGCCYARNRAYPTGTYWVVILLR